ncbi:MAG: S-ribosylhomocysteine lyase [Clostridia bacterium]|nr:S-ribosylhomocysteine lyase [Clostridia bacterium]MBQ2319572.1 S-ribosylhomocysteine lyase [Clostridia bacterium]
MKTIESFLVDHTVLTAGIYLSRVDGDAVTYDLRLKRPNVEKVLDNAPIHTIEHLFATYVRNSKYSESIIYFGPMGCRTGFYFIVRDNMSHETVVSLVKEAFNFIAAYDGEIPGVSAKECGNYLDHDLDGAKREAAIYADAIKNLTADDIYYKA